MFPLSIARVRRALHTPPSVLLRRLAQEADAGVDRFNAGGRGRTFDLRALLRATGAATLDELWTRLGARPFPFQTERVNAARYEVRCPGDTDRILLRAEMAVGHRVDLLGSGPLNLGPTIDWLTDHKTGHSWAPAFMRDIDYANLDRASDVKFPWELSRLQWLIPAGQAFLLTGHERYARAARAVLEQWIAANPYAGTVNWSCTMEVALRIVSWTWLFHAFSRSESWAGAEFRGRFLQALYLHGRFTAKYLEYSEVNGNHCTADAAGLVFAGLFFGAAHEPSRWQRRGWALLSDEITKQVSADGVDYEGSIAYHRLVLELFVLTARCREAHGLAIPPHYRRRVSAMGRFVIAYSRQDGTTPLLGDADDGRLLPFGGQPLNDHRYLVAFVGLTSDETMLPLFHGSTSEVFWVFGDEGLDRASEESRTQPSSCSFHEGGYYVMRNTTDHIFIDCAPVGLSGRGGHGHNDCLSFEAALCGALLVTDCGAYVYTASVHERNRFRSTDAHNTPLVGGHELNRLIAPENLWQLRDDAKPELRQWTSGPDRDVFIGSHSGYRRLDPPITPVRTIELRHASHSLRILDRFEGGGVHQVAIPLHLGPHVRVEGRDPTHLRLLAADQRFRVSWNPGWRLELETARVSPRYGVAINVSRLVWRGQTQPGAELDILIMPEPD